MKTASEKLTTALPEHLAKTVSYGATGGGFTVSMPVGVYEELMGQKFERGRSY